MRFPMTTPRLRAASLGLLGLLGLAPLTGVLGCADDVHQGNLNVPPTLGPLGPRGGASLAALPPRDSRPPNEREGEENRTRLFWTIAVVTHWERSGNYVTNDFAATADARGELDGVVHKGLTAARVAQLVLPEQRPSFVLETEIEHLYGTHYEVSSGTVVVIPGKRKNTVSGGGASVTTRQYASYGNVVLHARLIDNRTGQPVPVWDEHVVGTGQAMPSKEPIEAAQTAVREATADAVATLAVRLGAALDRLGQGPNGVPFVLTERLPPVFLIERVSRLRDFLETVYIETRSGLVLRHDIAPLADRAHGRPGEWLLSRRTPEGIWLSGEGYDAYARALAARYDVRAYDDAYRYHFFGVRGVLPPPQSPPE
jgi:hypothetical protein